MRNAITRSLVRGGLLGAVALGGLFLATVVSSSATGAPDWAKPNVLAADPARQAAKRPDLTTLPKIYRYLRSIGVDPKGVVVQRGPRNYAGPNCPGAAWNCTTARRVVQLSPFSTADGGGGNVFVCSPAGVGTDAPTNTCVIAQTGAGNNTARCTEGDSQASGTVQQECVIAQESTGGKANTARVTQGIAMSSTGTEQNAFQRTHIVQKSTGTNNATVVQAVNQKIDYDGVVAVDETQTAQQGTCLTQLDGRSTASVVQTQFQTESADGGAEVTQKQNAEDSGVGTAECNTAPAGTLIPGPAACMPGDFLVFAPNACAEIVQDSTGSTKRLDATLTQLIRQNQDVDGATAFVTQQQGAFGGGLLGDVDQFSSGRKRYVSSQQEPQKQHAVTTGGTFQNQVAPQRCCGFGTQAPGLAGDTINTRQESIQRNGDGSQSTRLLAECFTEPDGRCTMNQRAVNNGAADTGSFQGSSGAIFTTCFSGEGSSCPEEPPPTDTGSLLTATEGG